MKRVVTLEQGFSGVEQRVVVDEPRTEMIRHKPPDRELAAPGPAVDVQNEAHQPPFTAPAVSPATICRCAKAVSNSTGRVTISAAAARGPQESWSKEIML